MKGDKSGGTWRVKGADLIKHWATTHSGILSSGDLNAASFTALASAATYPLGFWFPAGDETTLRQAFDDASRCYRGYWLLDEDGVLEVGQVLPPSGDPVRIFRRDIDHKGLVPRAVAGRSMPARAARIRFARNFSPSEPGVLDTAAVNGDARNIATSEWREALSDDDADVVAAYGLNNARLIVRDTAIYDRTDAETEADALRDDAAVVRQIYDLPCTTLFAEIRRLDVVKIYDDLPGFEDGKLMRVVGISINQRGRVSSFVVRE